MIQITIPEPVTPEMIRKLIQDIPDGTVLSITLEEVNNAEEERE